MHPLMEQAALMVDFIAAAVGSNCEVVLQDIERQQIIKIANSHVSKRKAGAPLTDFALKVIATGEWRNSDSVTDYRGVLPDGTQLRSSTFFIKDGNELLGMLCINIDTTPYSKLITELSSLMGGGAFSHSVQPAASGTPLLTETFHSSVGDIISATIAEVFPGENIHPSRFTQDEKMLIVKKLSNKGVFHLKSAISEVAKSLACSEATIYRYLSKLGKQE